jgi:hypothetical protein
MVLLQGNPIFESLGSNDGDTRCHSSSMEQTLVSSGSEVERCVPSRIEDGRSWRHGATEDRWRVRVVLHAQAGGTIRRHGGVVVALMENLVRGFTLV